MRATFSVVGLPGPKGSLTTRGKRSWNPSKVGVQWEKDVEAQAPHGLVCDPPYHVMLRFRMPAPKKRTHPYPSRADLDKLTRCTIDGLVKAGAIADDVHVVFLTAFKRYAEPGEDTGAEVVVGPWQSST